jgi:hypothetical protein
MVVPAEHTFVMERHEALFEMADNEHFPAKVEPRFA